MTPEEKVTLETLFAQIPAHIQADWDGTNHWEINDPTAGTRPEDDADYFWLDLWELAQRDWRSNSEEGQRTGALLDLACLARRVLPELMGEIEILRHALGFGRFYSEEVFTPLTAEDVMKIGSAFDVIAAGVANPSDRLHAQWARQLAAAVQAEIKRLKEEERVNP